MDYSSVPGGSPPCLCGGPEGSMEGKGSLTPTQPLLRICSSCAASVGCKCREAANTVGSHKRNYQTEFTDGLLSLSQQLPHLMIMRFL